MEAGFPQKPNSSSASLLQLPPLSKCSLQRQSEKSFNSFLVRKQVCRKGPRNGTDSINQYENIGHTCRGIS